MKKVNYYLKLVMTVFVVTMLVMSCEDEVATPTPLAFFTYEAAADNSQMIVFTNDSESGDAYLWEFGDGGTSTDVNPSHEYVEAGPYTVKLTATNAGGDNVYSDDITVMSAAPVAFFTSEAAADNLQMITFTNETESGDTYSWEFGDGATSNDLSPSHEYAEVGTYTVKLTATNASGDNVYSDDITVMSAAPVNVIVNGELDDDSNWTVQQFNANNNGSVTFADGVVVLNEIVDIAEGGWGEEGHAGMYQAIELEAGNYIFDMDFITEGINETWCEVWIGTAAPVVDEDYNGDIGAVRIGLINAWDCPETNTYTGALSAGPVCVPESFELTETATYYVVIRAGGFNFGPNGITIDNLSLLSN